MQSADQGHMQHASDGVDRQNRFLSTGSETPNGLSLRERAASQPPRTQNFVAPPPQVVRNNSGGGSAAPSASWGRFAANLNPLPQSVPTRSASFSSSPLSAHSPFSSAMRDSRFASTFEDDESEALSDVQDPYDLYDERFPRSSIALRGRSYAADLTRSRSQSLATSRPGAIGSGFPGQVYGQQWEGSSPQSIPSRYDFKTPTSGSRYGSLGALGRSPSNGYGQGSIADPSNMSPFVRDVGQILLDDGSAFRELWSGMNPPRDENGGGGSGTTSRRHSVSVVQPRRPIVGFNAPNADMQDDGHAGSFAHQASDLGLMSMNDARSVTSIQPPSQPSSLPIYAPLSRSPPTSDRVSPYQPLHLNIPGGGGSSFSRQSIVGSPSDSGLSGERREQSRPRGLMARYVPGIGIQQIHETGVMQSPLSSAALRSPAHYGAQQPMPRRTSDASKTLMELGKGVPLHAVPTSWPLFIVEFKAHRTDLFYCTDLSQDIRVGDLVIVEADRGRIRQGINDTITLVEIEAPTTATAGGGAKDINPKMMYGKAQHRDIQSLAAKAQDEMKALELCRTKVRQRKLPMEVVDAEYQWDRRKLTFYFVAEKRIDFRELVRELFRLYKTRIWMAALPHSLGSLEQ
ncbi:PSP1-domain-containing protein [Epithele typhae]|uniref:PSP1-domain-containing protein n=1 Tax=Epithele typhae TaxID=378194 RepID=UPI002007B9CB|nr:PSP1-domain-containing protein [Epithele typhae]KAH9927441.1 PSP1-domain-containing protein [Epithele typhae]